MPENISKHTLGLTQLQSGQGIPNHNADKGSLYIDVLTTDYYKNTDGLNTWVLLSSGGVSGDYLPLSGGTVSGGTIFTSGVTANTISNVQYIDFNKTASTTHVEGRVHWNNDIKSLEIDTENPEVQLEVGHELVLRVVNKTGADIPKGRAVYIDGEQGQRPTIRLASFTADTTSASVVGLTMAQINNNQNGYVILNGLLVGSISEPLDTSSYSAGTPLYLLTGGTLTDIKPQAPDHDVRIGKVVVSNATTGSIYVQVQNGYELDELHDVRITNKTFGDIITLSAYNGNDVWVNSKTLNGSYTITGNTVINQGLSANTISGGTISGIGTGLINIPISGVTNLQNSLNNKFDTSGGTVIGSVTVTGNVTILGTATTINTETLSVKDNVITLNSTFSAGTPFFGNSGIEVLRGSATTTTLLWDESNLKWYAGLSGDTKQILLSGDSLSLLNSGHTHPISQINNLQLSLDDKLSKLTGGTVSGFTSFNNGLSAYTISTDELIIPFKSIGVFDPGDPPTYPFNQVTIGGYFESLSGSNRYSLQLKDGTEGINKVLVSKTNDGKANWSNNLDISGITAITLNVNGNLTVTGNTNLQSFTAGTGTINGNLLVTGTTSASTLTITSTPTLNNDNVQILTRNSTSGNIEYSDSTSANIFNYGLANAMVNLNFLT
jgi:hypothetical protein